MTGVGSFEGFGLDKAVVVDEVPTGVVLEGLARELGVDCVVHHPSLEYVFKN